MKKFIILILITIVVSCSSKNSKEYSNPQEIVITGKIANFNPNNLQIAMIVNRIGMEWERIGIGINNDGSFKTKIKSYIPGDIRLMYDKANFLFLAYPKDSIHIEFDNLKKQNILETVQFSGNNAESNSKVLKFQSMVNSNAVNQEKIDKSTKSLDPIQFTEFMDSLNQIQLSIYNKFIERENPNEDVKNWASIHYKEPYNYFMSWYPDNHAMSNKLGEWRVPLNFYDFQKKMLPLKKESLISSYQISMFTNQYLGNVKEHIYQNNKSVLDKRPQSLNQDSLWLNGIVRYTKDPLLRQLVLTETIRKSLDRKELSMFENYQDLIRINITNSFLLNPLNEKYKKIKEQVENPEIASNAILKDMRGSKIEKVMDSIISRNKGKIVYIDFWGPWCGPCIKELPYSKNLMNELNKEEISFVYLCIDSNYKRWKAKLSELKLEGQHYFFDKEQSTELRNVFKINGVPRYVLLNKEGTIIDQTAKRPSDPKLKEELLELLKNK